ncbi:MAG: TIGR02530 family flagellar biosynthesis protein [Oscillospiraceae bacterium]
MLISEYLQLRNISSVIPTGASDVSAGRSDNTENSGAAGSPFAAELQKQLDAAGRITDVNAEDLSEQSGVDFSKHAVERINERRIDLYSDGRLERLGKAVSLAEEKGSDNALILIDQAAFLVSVKNNKVITTVNTDEMTGNIFTNIDSTVIM